MPQFFKPAQAFVTSNQCATCHEVSNPAYTKQGDGSYALNALGVEHPTGVQADMFPVERTYGEWAQSQFASGGVQLNGRFGGNHPTGVMESCQDCHMPDQVGYGCRGQSPQAQSAVPLDGRAAGRHDGGLGQRLHSYATPGRADAPRR